MLIPDWKSTETRKNIKYGILVDKMAHEEWRHLIGDQFMAYRMFVYRCMIYMYVWFRKG